MTEYNDHHLKVRNLRLELEEGGLWMCLVYIVPETAGLGVQNYAHGLLLPPYPPNNAYPGYQGNNEVWQDPALFENQPEAKYGTAIPYQPVMPNQQNDGWEHPMIDMYQAPPPGVNNYYQPPITQMQPTYDQEPQNPVMANIYSNNIQIPDDTHGINIQHKDVEDPKKSQVSNSAESFNF